ncbi:MAG: hypothetical protein PHU07_06235 [Acidocella sp.]|nr:hypothetical protein [Acidocella sp.]
MKDHFDRLILSEKVIVSSASWSAPESTSLKMHWNSPVEIDGVTQEGLFIRGVCYEDRQDEAVTLQIEVGSLGSRTRIPLCRLDWRPTAEVHRNNKILSSRYGLPRIIKKCHFHPFHMNWDDETLKMRESNLPLAYEIQEKINSFSNLLEFFGKKCNIKGVKNIPEPNWSRKLI